MGPAEPSDSPHSVVGALLGAHGVVPPAADLEALEKLYPAIRRRMDRLYTVDCADGAPILLGMAGRPSGGRFDDEGNRP